MIITVAHAGKKPGDFRVMEEAVGEHIHHRGNAGIIRVMAKMSYR